MTKPWEIPPCPNCGMHLDSYEKGVLKCYGGCRKLWYREKEELVEVDPSTLKPTQTDSLEELVRGWRDPEQAITISQKDGLSSAERHKVKAIKAYARSELEKFAEDVKHGVARAAGRNMGTRRGLSQLSYGIKVVDQALQAHKEEK